MTGSHQRAWNANPDIYSVIKNGHCYYKDISVHCNKNSKTIRNKKERFLLSYSAISVNSNQFRHRRSQPVEPRHAPREAPLPNLFPHCGNSEAPSRTPHPQRVYSRAHTPSAGREPPSQNWGRDPPAHGKLKYTLNFNPHSTSGGKTNPEQRLSRRALPHAPRQARLLPSSSATPLEKLRYRPFFPFRSPGNSEAPSRTPHPQRVYSRAHAPSAVLRGPPSTGKPKYPFTTPK